MSSIRLGVALAGAALTLSACGSATETIPPWPVGSASEIAKLRERDDLNVVLIVIDTLRADHLGAYGYARDTSPLMDRMMRMGVRFERVRAQSSWTKTSMASLWTGAYPASTGIHRYTDGLGEAAAMPAERLQQAGFATCGIFRNGWVSANFGFDRGFDLYIKPAPNRDPERFEQPDPSDRALQGTDFDATQAAVSFLQAQGHERFFLYVHYMDVHQYLYEKESALFGTSLMDAYDNAIHWTDRNVGTIFTQLERLDLLRKTIFVVASDHGEAFREHAEEGHGRNLYSEVTSVPLFLTLPFRLTEPIVVRPWVRNIDIWPSLLDLLGMPQPEGVEGISLVPLIESAAAGADQQAHAPKETVASLDRSWGRVGAEPRLLVSRTRGAHRILVSDGAPRTFELYDLASDPREQENLAASHPELTSELADEAARYLKRRDDAGLAVEVELDELELQQLRALGYRVGR